MIPRQHARSRAKYATGLLALPGGVREGGSETKEGFSGQLKALGDVWGQNVDCFGQEPGVLRLVRHKSLQNGSAAEYMRST
jgi:hypothetical protein